MIRKIVFLSSLFSVLSLILYPIAEAQTPSSTQTQPPTQQAPPQIAPAPAPTVRGTGSPGSPGSEDDLSYRIGPGDELDIRVFGRAELSRTVRVDNYGKIRLPFLQEMPAACFTEAQLAGQVAEKYKKFLRDPQVDVLVKEYRSQPVAVIGAVNQPGRFQLQRRARALELITFAGGPKTTAVGGVVHIIHNGELDHCAQTAARNQPENGENGNPVAQPITSIKLTEMMAGTADSNPFVLPGDVISVPEADQIFVTGFVIRPGAYPMNPGLTLTQAVALAGGVNPDGSIGRVRLIRGTPGKGDSKETVYNLHDIHKRKIQDVALNVNDIVEIPSSTSRIAYRGALGVGINLLNSLPFFILR